MALCRFLGASRGSFRGGGRRVWLETFGVLPYLEGSPVFGTTRIWCGGHSHLIFVLLGEVDVFVGA